MNPYQTAFKWRSQPFICGITHEGKHKPSSSGARLYLRGPDKLVEECFNVVLRLLPQQDFDDDAESNFAVCTLQDGRRIRWAAMTHEAVLAELGLPDQGAWQKLTTQQKSKADRAAADAVAVAAAVAGAAKFAAAAW